MSAAGGANGVPGATTAWISCLLPVMSPCWAHSSEPVTMTGAVTVEAVSRESTSVKSLAAETAVAT
jgi:hypothetical protein